MRILLVEDEHLIGDGIKNGLEHNGFIVDWFTDGEKGYQAMSMAPFDAVILDLSLPGMDGMAILAKWRQQQHSIPVLILTARDSLSQRVEGLNAGADDYMCKPFAIAELIARLNALIRRSHERSEPLFTHLDVVLDPNSRAVTRGGVPVILTSKEVTLLQLFLLKKNHLMSRAMLEEKLYSWDQDVGSNAVEVHIHHLRRKLGNDFIRTIRGQGYCLGDKN